MKKALLLLLILLPGVIADNNVSIFKGKVNSDYPFTVNNKTFNIIFIRELNNTVVRLPENLSLIISRNETCAETWIYRVCRTSVKFMKGKIELPSDVHGTNMNITMDIQIYSSPLSLAYVRSIKKLSYFVGEEADINVTLKNSGELDISDILLRENLPEGIELVSADGCRNERNTLYWETSLDSNTQKACSYRIRMLSAGSFSLIQNLTYTVLGKKTSASDTKKLTVEASPIKFLYPDAVQGKPGVQSNFSVNITAVSNVTATLRILFPPEMTYSSENLTPQAKGLSWNRSMKKGDSLRMDFLAASRLAGDYSINYSLAYTFNSVTQARELKTSFSVVPDAFYVKLTNRSNQTMLMIVNPTTFDYNSVTVYVGTINQTIPVGSLESKTNKEYMLPKLGSAPDITVRYKTEYGQYLSFTQQGSASGEESLPSSNATPGKPADTPGQKTTGSESKIAIAVPFPFLIGVIAVALLIVILLVFFMSKKGRDFSKEVHDIAKEEAQAPYKEIKE